MWKGVFLFVLKGIFYIVFIFWWEWSISTLTERKIGDIRERGVNYWSKNAWLAESGRDPVHKLEEWPYGNVESCSTVIGETSGYMQVGWQTCGFEDEVVLFWLFIFSLLNKKWNHQLRIIKGSCLGFPQGRAVWNSCLGEDSKLTGNI